MKCSRKYNLEREGHIEMVHLCFVAEIVLVVITNKMVDGMFPSCFVGALHTDEISLYCDLGRKWKVMQCNEILHYLVTFHLHSLYSYN